MSTEKQIESAFDKVKETVNKTSQQVSSAAHGAYETASKQVGSSLNKASEQVSSTLCKASDHVQKQPIQVVLFTLALGVLVGIFLLSRRR